MLCRLPRFFIPRLTTNLISSISSGYRIASFFRLEIYSLYYTHFSRFTQHSLAAHSSSMSYESMKNKEEYVIPIDDRSLKRAPTIQSLGRTLGCISCKRNLDLLTRKHNCGSITPSLVFKWHLWSIYRKRSKRVTVNTASISELNFPFVFTVEFTDNWSFFIHLKE